MEQWATSQSSRTAPPPFDGHDYDLILRSSDAVDFHLHRHLLARVSTEFEALVLQATDAWPEPTDDLAIRTLPAVHLIQLPEDSDTLYAILQRCYAVPQKTLDHVVRQLEAAAKYGVSEQLAVLRHGLLEFAHKDPERVFAVGCCFRVAEAAALAAKESRNTKRYDNRRFVPEMKGVSAAALFRLRQFRCGLSPPEEVERVDCGTQAGPSFTLGDPEGLQPIPDVQIITEDGITIECHSFCLTMASQVLGELVRDARFDDPDSPTLTIRLQEDCSTTYRLLELVYHHGHPTVDSLDALKVFAHLAATYAIHDGTSYLRVQLMRLPEVSAAPMRVFFFAVMQRWHDEARTIAQALAQRPHADTELAGTYVPEMEDVSALAYHRLLEYADACLYAAEAVVARYDEGAVERIRARNDYLSKFTNRLYLKKTGASGESVHLRNSPFDTVISGLLGSNAVVDERLPGQPVARLVFLNHRVRMEICEALSEIHLELEDIPDLTQATLRPLAFMYEAGDLNYDLPPRTPSPLAHEDEDEDEDEDIYDDFKENHPPEAQPEEVLAGEQLPQDGLEPDSEQDEEEDNRSAYDSYEDVESAGEGMGPTDEEYDGLSESSASGNQANSEDEESDYTSYALDEPVGPKRRGISRSL